MILARVACLETDPDTVTVDHRVRRFIRPSLIRDPASEQDVQEMVVAVAAEETNSEAASEQANPLDSDEQAEAAGDEHTVENAESDSDSAPVVEAEVVTDALVAPDDLTKIKFIGPTTQSSLYGAGVKTYSQLIAAFDAGELQKFSTSLNKVNTWKKQATFAMNGQWEELKNYKDSL